MVEHDALRKALLFLVVIERATTLVCVLQVHDLIQISTQMTYDLYI